MEKIKMGGGGQKYSFGIQVLEFSLLPKTNFRGCHPKNTTLEGDPGKIKIWEGVSEIFHSAPPSETKME